MTATNHMLAGAVIAVSLQRPLLIIPAAVISHFALDILPHFGVHKHDHVRRNKHPLFQYMLALDITLAMAMLCLLPSVLQGAVPAWILLLGMCFAFLPDVVWSYHFFNEYAGRQYTLKRNKLTIFHDKIQWGERTWGVFIEILFFGCMGVALGLLAS